MSNTLTTLKKPKLGFAGIGWIGQHRLEAVIKSQLAEVVGFSDSNKELCRKAKASVPNAISYDSFEALLEGDAEGIIIATPSALHAEQSIAALNKGKAVFCQKPLGRNVEETRAVVEAAKHNNCLLGVDFSYRYSQAIQKVKEEIQSGSLGELYAVNLVFHNAYGPDKPWYYDPKLSGGGCLMDLGVHLIDLLLWLLKPSTVTSVKSSLFQQGIKLKDRGSSVEDYAVAQLELDHQLVAQISCSWHLSAGKEAIIEASFYGTNGGVAFRNIAGSFYDFKAERYNGTATETLCEPPDSWGGKAIIAWAKQLSKGNSFNKDSQSFIKVAEVLDAIYEA